MIREHELRAKAVKRAQDTVGVCTHLGIYAVMNAFFAGIWFFTSGLSSFPWFVFPLTAWGIGVAAHFLSGFLGEGLVERMTEQELARLRHPQGETRAGPSRGRTGRARFASDVVCLYAGPLWHGTGPPGTCGPWGPPWRSSSDGSWCPPPSPKRPADPPPSALPLRPRPPFFPTRGHSGTS